MQHFRFKSHWVTFHQWWTLVISWEETIILSLMTYFSKITPLFKYIFLDNFSRINSHMNPFYPELIYSIESQKTSITFITISTNLIKKCHIIKNIRACGWRDAPVLKSLVSLSEDLSLHTTIHRVLHSDRELQLQRICTLFWPSKAPGMQVVHAGKTLIPNKNEINRF